MRRGPLMGLVALVMCGPLSCGGGGGGLDATPTGPTTPSTPAPTPGTPATSNDVTVQNNSFAPASITEATGSTVKWTWDTCTTGYDPYGGTGTTCVQHSVTWDAPGGTNSPTQGEGTYSRTFAAPGTYTYHCAVHGAAMTGKVVVQ